MDIEEIRSRKSAIQYSQCQVTRQGHVIDGLLVRPCSPKEMLEAIEKFDVARQKFSSALVDYYRLLDPTQENTYYNEKCQYLARIGDRINALYLGCHERFNQQPQAEFAEGGGTWECFSDQSSIASLTVEEVPRNVIPKTHSVQVLNHEDKEKKVLELQRRAREVKWAMRRQEIDNRRELLALELQEKEKILQEQAEALNAEMVSNHDMHITASASEINCNLGAHNSIMSDYRGVMDSSNSNNVTDGSAVVHIITPATASLASTCAPSMQLQYEKTGGRVSSSAHCVSLNPYVTQTICTAATSTVVSPRINPVTVHPIIPSSTSYYYGAQLSGEVGTASSNSTTMNCAKIQDRPLYSPVPPKTPPSDNVSTRRNSRRRYRETRADYCSGRTDEFDAEQSSRLAALEREVVLQRQLLEIKKASLSLSNQRSSNEIPTQGPTLGNAVLQPLKPHIADENILQIPAMRYQTHTPTPSNSQGVNQQDLMVALMRKGFASQGDAVEKFDGSSRAYPAFRYRFEQNTAKLISDPGCCLEILLASCTGKAKKAISWVCLNPDPAKGLKEALEVLERDFGTPHKISDAQLKQLHEGPKVPDTEEGLQDLLCDLRNCRMVMEYQNRATALDQEANLRPIFERLPHYLQIKFENEAAKQPEGLPTYQLLVEVVEAQQRRYSGSVGQWRAKLRKSNNQINRQQRHHIHVNATQTTPQGANYVERSQRPVKPNESYVRQSRPFEPNSSQGRPPRPPGVNNYYHEGPCTLCQGAAHTKLSECQAYMTSSPEGRQRALKTENRCFKCLERGHRIRHCRSNIQCSEPGCTGHHHTTLHAANRMRRSNSAHHPTSGRPQIQSPLQQSS